MTISPRIASIPASRSIPSAAIAASTPSTFPAPIRRISPSTPAASTISIRPRCVRAAFSTGATGKTLLPAALRKQAGASAALGGSNFGQRHGVEDAGVQAILGQNCQTSLTLTRANLSAYEKTANQRFLDIVARQYQSDLA